jgi:hypothetical protein
MTKKKGACAPFLFLFLSHNSTTMIAATKSPYLDTIAKKRPWQAVPVSRGKVADGSEATLFKALALRHLEIPVKVFLEQGLERELPSTAGVVEALKSNMADEERHDEALSYVASAHGVDEKAERDVFNILKVWNEHPAHPVHKASILERSIFFVALPFFRQNGDIGMRTVSADISRDERVHTAIHGMVAKELGEEDSQSLNRLRAATAAWLFEDLRSNENHWLDKDFWMRQSESLFFTGKAPEMAQTRRSRQIAFFESSNVDLPSYGRQ